MVNRYKVYIISGGTEHELLENVFHDFFIIVFGEVFIKLKSFFYPFKIIYWKLF